MTKTLIFSIFSTILKRRDAQIFLSFSLFPILVPFLSGNLEGLEVDYTRSFISFLDISLLTQYRLVLPILIFSILISSVFRDEIDAGILFLYKDINRKLIYNAKLFGLVMLYGIYVLATSFSTFLVYYLILIPQKGVANQFFPMETVALQQSLLSITALVFLNIITIVLVAMVAVKRKTIVAVLSGVFFTLFAVTAPLLIGIRYLIPTTYANLYNGGVFSTLLPILGISALYACVCYVKGGKDFKDVEF